LSESKDQSIFWKLGYVQGMLSSLAFHAEDTSPESLREAGKKGEAFLQEVIDELQEGYRLQRERRAKGSL
jgi:hypothetical protein